MMKTLSTVTKDYSALITLDEAKNWLNVVGTQDDQLVSALIKGACTYAESYLNRTVGQNSYIMSMDDFEDRIYLMRPPVATVSRIEYLDSKGVSQDYDLAKTGLDMDMGVLYPTFEQDWPDTANTPFAVKIHYSCDGLFQLNDGDDILDAIKMTLGFHYDYRDDINQRWRKASDNILAPHRLASI